MKKRHHVSLLIPVLIFFFSVSYAAGQTGATYIGSDTCLDCHDDVFSSMIKTPHHDISMNRDSVQVESCESCHGPGSGHIDDPEKKGSIRSFDGDSVADITTTCLSCHQGGTLFRYSLSQKHAQLGESCITCHTLHQTAPRDRLLAAPPGDLCFDCHQESKQAFALPFHHKVPEGRMACWSCHDPHNAKISSQRIGSKSLYERCSSCHPSQKGPFTHEHLSVNVGGCGVCHEAHGSENPRLLKRANQHLLCLECHSGPSMSDQLLGPLTPSFHITSKTTYQNCTVCHIRIHGSYLDRYFLR